MMLRFKKHRTFITATILSLLLILAGGFVFSQSGTRYLEIDYPIIDGESPTSTKTFLHTYIKYIFNQTVKPLGLTLYNGIEFLPGLGIRSFTVNKHFRISCN